MGMTSRTDRLLDRPARRYSLTRTTNIRRAVLGSAVAVPFVPAHSRLCPFPQSFRPEMATLILRMPIAGWPEDGWNILEQARTGFERALTGPHID